MTKQRVLKFKYGRIEIDGDRRMFYFGEELSPSGIEWLSTQNPNLETNPAKRAAMIIGEALVEDAVERDRFAGRLVNALDSLRSADGYVASTLEDVTR